MIRLLNGLGRRRLAEFMPLLTWAVATPLTPLKGSSRPGPRED
jgi:hypothetical protein